MSKVTIITGGTSGIGRGIAEKILANSGADDILYVSTIRNKPKNFSMPSPKLTRRNSV